MLSVLRPSFFRSSNDCAQTAVAPDRTAAANRILMAPPLRAGTCYARGGAYRNARSARLKIQCRPREGEWQRRSGRFWPFRTIPRTPSAARKRGFSTSRRWRRWALRSSVSSVKFGSSGVGTPVHLAGELMMQLTGISMVHVPYKGIAPAMAAILGGEIQITYAAVLSGLQHFKSGRLRPLAVASRSRYPALPEVPTAAEAGLSGYEIDFWYALLGPGGMPGSLVDRIQREVAAVLGTPEMKEGLLAQG